MRCQFQHNNSAVHWTTRHVLTVARVAFHPRRGRLKTHMMFSDPDSDLVGLPHEERCAHVTNRLRLVERCRQHNLREPTVHGEVRVLQPRVHVQENVAWLHVRMPKCSHRVTESRLLPVVHDPPLLLDRCQRNVALDHRGGRLQAAAMHEVHALAEGETRLEDSNIHVQRTVEGCEIVKKR